MRALDPEVVDVLWSAVEPLLPPREQTHPLGCHRPRGPDRLCFRGLLIRLVTGSSWVDIEAILDHQVSDTTLRSRRDEWIAAGIFEQLKDEALAAFDRIVGLDMDNLSIDGSLHKAPAGGEGTGPDPTDRGKCGWKRSVAAEGHGLPIGWAIDGANRNDLRLLHPTLDAVEATGLHHDIGMLHLDRGYDYPKTRAELAVVSAGEEGQPLPTWVRLETACRPGLGTDREVGGGSRSRLDLGTALRRSAHRGVLEEDEACCSDLGGNFAEDAGAAGDVEVEVLVAQLASPFEPGPMRHEPRAGGADRRGQPRRR